MFDPEKTSKILKALSHPDRMKIAIGLYHDECNVSECQRKMDLPQSTISQHLRILREAGIIVSRREGTKVCNKVVDELTIGIIKLMEG